MKTQLLTRKVLHGCPRRLRPPALELFRQQSSLGKIGKEEPWTLEIISYRSDKLSSILDYFTFHPQKRYFTNSAQKSGAICLSRPRIPARLRVPKSPRPTSHVPVPLLVTAVAESMKIVWTSLLIQSCHTSSTRLSATKMEVC